MNQIRHIVIAILEQITKSIKELSDDELNSVISGDTKLSFDVGRGPRTRHSKRDFGNKRKNRKVTAAEGRTLVERLKLIEEREEGYKLLAVSHTKKDELAQITRMLDLPINKSDSIERLRDKIIEATIGYRLRSQAVQGREEPDE